MPWSTNLIMLNIDKMLSLTLSKNLVFEADLVFNNTYAAPSGWSVASSPNLRGVAIVAATDTIWKGMIADLCCHRNIIFQDIYFCIVLF